MYWYGDCPDVLPFRLYLLHASVLFLFSIRRTEHSALKVLREQLFAHKSDLISAFQEFDKKNTGAVLLTKHTLKGQLGFRS